MDRKYIFSLIIPIYNIEDYLEKCLRSIVNQSFVNYEVILIDDGSTDKSSQICDGFCTGQKDWKVIHKANEGVSAARNEGIKISNGEWLIFIDGDDYVSSDFLENFWHMVQKNVDMGIMGVNVDGRNLVLKGNQKENGYKDQKWLIGSLVKRDSIRGFLFNKVFASSIVINNHISFNKSIYMCEDLLFCMQYSVHCTNVYFQNMPLYHYVQHSNSASRKRFNYQRITVLDAYSQIIRIVELFGDSSGIKITQANYLIHHAKLYLMLRQKKEYIKEKKAVSNYIVHHITDIFSANIEWKSIFITILSFLMSVFHL